MRAPRRLSIAAALLALGLGGCAGYGKPIGLSNVPTEIVPGSMCLSLLVRDGLGIPTVKSTHQPVSVKIALPRRQERLAQIDLLRLGLPSGVFLDQPRLAPYAVATGALMPLRSPKAVASLTPNNPSSPASLAFLRELSELLSRQYAYSMGASSSLGQGLTVSPVVNTFTGNLFVSSLDAAALWRGLNVMVYRTYNGLQRTPGPFGPGWMHNFSSRLDFNEDQSIQYTRWDGSRFCYKPDGHGGYKSPDGFDDRLSRTGTGFRMEDETGFYVLFDAKGTIQEIGNPLPFRLRFTYDAGGRLVEVRNVRSGDTNPLWKGGAKMTGLSDEPTSTGEGPGVFFTYDEESRITQIRSTSGNEMKYAYGDNGRLTRVISNTQQVVEYRYDPDGRLAEVRRQDPSGLKGSMLYGILYDASDRVAQILDEGGRPTMRLSYRWAEDRTTEIVLGNDQQTIVTDYYDPRGVLEERTETVRSSDPTKQAGASASRQRRETDNDLNVTRVDRADSTNTRWTYDSRGRLVRAQDSGGDWVEITWNDEFNLPEYQRESHGRWIRFRYGTSGETHRTTRGQIEEVELDDGSHFKLVYDDGGVPRELINATGAAQPLDLGLPPEVPKQIWEF